jgi:hypothetical protein
MRRRCIAVALAETPPEVLVVRPRRTLTGSAWAIPGLRVGELLAHGIAAPRPFTRRGLYVYLHEVAHVVLRHCDPTVRVRLASSEREEQAEKWAQQAMRRHGLAVPKKELRRAKAYVARKRVAEARALQKRRDGP